MSAIERGFLHGQDATLRNGIDAVIARLHWRVLQFGLHELTAGSTRQDLSAGIRFHYVAVGAVELRRRGEETHVMQAGDFVMAPREGAIELHVTRDTTLLSGSLALQGIDAIAPDLMPSLLFTCGFRVSEPLFASLLEMMHHEASHARAGSESVIERLADIVASAAVRVWLEKGCGSAREWLAPTIDPHLSRALDAIHDDPGSPWTVESLARLARASRSQFAEQFRHAIGDTPARYLTRVRMERAEEMLRAGASVTDVAYRLGYESDAGFSRAFRRHAGQSPSAWRRQAGSATEHARIVGRAISHVA